MTNAMPKPVSLIGLRFGRLIVLEKAASKPSRYLCRCDCGAEVVRTGHDLSSGDTKSCGCLRKDVASESAKKRFTKHGHNPSGNPSKTYEAWHSMIQRCCNPNHKQFSYYGGRGITVCDRWRAFENFLADMGCPDNELTLDRINNEGSYGPDNCRWATCTQQNRNKRGNTVITFNGRTGCLSEICEWVHISYSVVKARLRLGWSIDQALNLPVRRLKRLKARALENP